MNYDIAFCSAVECKRTDCERHMGNLKEGVSPTGYVTVSDLAGVCRQYISDVVDEVMNESGRK